MHHDTTFVPGTVTGLLGALALFALFGACDTDAIDNESDAATTTDVRGARDEARQARAQVTLNPATSFDLAWDPGRDDLSLHVATPARAPDLRVTAQGLFCPEGDGDAVPGFSLRTVPGSIGLTPAACGLPNEEPYATMGVLCLDVELTNDLSFRALDVYIELTRIVPSTGHAGYAFPFGTGADPDAVPDATNAPTGAAGGLWSFGDVLPGEAVAGQLVLEYTPEPFSFEGHVLVAMPERIDGADDNCNGFADEQPFADGEACTSDVQCYH